jgi:hypothetical protein
MNREQRSYERHRWFVCVIGLEPMSKYRVLVGNEVNSNNLFPEFIFNVWFFGDFEDYFLSLVDDKN